MKRKLIARNKSKLSLHFRQLVEALKRGSRKPELSYSDIADLKKKGQEAFERRLLSFENMNARQKKKRQKRLVDIGYDERRYQGMTRVRLGPAVAKWRR